MNRRGKAATGMVVVTCLSCSWSAERSTWRPARRALAEHASRKHPRPVLAAETRG